MDHSGSRTTGPIIDSDDDNISTIVVDDIPITNDQKSKFILKLDLDFKDKLINLLNEYSKLLISDKKITINKKELIESKNNLILSLTKSRSKLEKESNFNKFIINLDEKYKYEIIDLLIKNEEIAIDSIGEIDLNLKNELIKMNFDIINKLNNLKIEFINNSVVNLVDNCEEESKDDTINLKEENNRLKKQLEQIHINREIPFTLNWVIKDIKNFFKTKSSISSKAIEFYNIKWYIAINSRYLSEKYLSFYLQASNPVDDNNFVRWECKITYDLILKTNLPDKDDKIIRYNYYTFNKSFGFGSHRFISEEELFNNENGFIKYDDSIELEVKLNVHSLKRYL